MRSCTGRIEPQQQAHSPSRRGRDGRIFTSRADPSKPPYGAALLQDRG